MEFWTLRLRTKIFHSDATRFKTRGTARRSAAWDAEQGCGRQGRGTSSSFR